MAHVNRINSETLPISPEKLLLAIGPHPGPGAFETALGLLTCLTRTGAA